MDNTSTERKTEVKKTYQKPKLIVHGTLAQLTRGEEQVHTDGFFSGGSESHS